MSSWMPFVPRCTEHVFTSGYIESEGVSCWLHMSFKVTKEDSCEFSLKSLKN